MQQKAGSLRETIDKMTPRPELVKGLTSDNKQLLTARATLKTIGQATNARAEAWRSQIKALISNA